MLKNEQLLRFSRRYLINEACKTAEHMQYLPYVELRERAKQIIDMCDKVDWIEEQLEQISPDDPE